MVLFTELTAHSEIKNPLRTLSEATDQSVAIPDEDIDLGSMQFLPGRGFMLDGNSGSVAVAKSVQVIEELTVSGGVTNLAKVYTPGLALISQRQRPSATVSFYGTDGHGSVRFLASTAGAITDTYTFDAFGTLIASTGTTANNFLFCGEQWDPDLARYFNRARYWEPGIGRFSSRDTIQGSQSDPVSLHQYLYCHDDGVNNADPSGQMTLADVQVAVSTWGLLATTVAYRAAPYINRATVLLFEANTGNTVYLGGGGAAVALRAGTKLGGVGWATWQSIGNLLKGLGARIGTHKELAKVLERTGEQANHLNQAAAFPRIPYDEGVAAAIRGGTNLKGTAHHLFHESLETFWNQFRRNGARFRDVPKNAEYDTAMRRALEAAGETSENIEPFAKLAEESRRAFGYFDGPGGVAPEVPNPIPGY